MKFRLKLDKTEFLKWWINFQIKNFGDFEPNIKSFCKKVQIDHARIIVSRKSTTKRSKMYVWALENGVQQELFEEINESN